MLSADKYLPSRRYLSKTLSSIIPSVSNTPTSQIHVATHPSNDNNSITKPSLTGLNQTTASSETGNEITLRALITSKEAGFVIGKSGKLISEIRTATNTKAGISKAVGGVNERELYVTGSVESVANAFGLITESLRVNTLLEYRQNEISIVFLLTHQVVGSIMGKAGSKIKHIEKSSRAIISISKEVQGTSNERLVKVTGSVESLQKAIKSIGECVLLNVERQDKPNFTLTCNPIKAVYHNDNKQSQTIKKSTPNMKTTVNDSRKDVVESNSDACSKQTYSAANSRIDQKHAVSDVELWAELDWNNNNEVNHMENNQPKKTENLIESETVITTKPSRSLDLIKTSDFEPLGNEDDDLSFAYFDEAVELLFDLCDSIESFEIKTGTSPIHRTKPEKESIKSLLTADREFIEDIKRRSVALTNIVNSTHWDENGHYDSTSNKLDHSEVSTVANSNSKYIETPTQLPQHATQLASGRSMNLNNHLDTKFPHLFKR